mmetsp:Transcript_35021/g.105782  ORF Transcript_35021/g.105782 Transcript_35021/m.105782 type:complete len:240 (+) Transcript_35021:110-829(+)
MRPPVTSPGPRADNGTPAPPPALPAVLARALSGTAASTRRCPAWACMGTLSIGPRTRSLRDGMVVIVFVDRLSPRSVWGIGTWGSGRLGCSSARGCAHDRATVVIFVGSQPAGALLLVIQCLRFCNSSSKSFSCRSLASLFWPNLGSRSVKQPRPTSPIDKASTCCRITVEPPNPSSSSSDSPSSKSAMSSSAAVPGSDAAASTALSSADACSSCSGEDSASSAPLSCTGGNSDNSVLS